MGALRVAVVSLPRFSHLTSQLPYGQNVLLPVKLDMHSLQACIRWASLSRVLSKLLTANLAACTRAGSKALMSAAMLRLAFRPNGQCGTQGAYKDYATAIILRQNTITGTLYRDDPNILAWDLINEPANNGDQSGDVLYVRTASMHGHAWRAGKLVWSRHAMLEIAIGRLRNSNSWHRIFMAMQQAERMIAFHAVCPFSNSSAHPGLAH